MLCVKETGNDLLLVQAEQNDSCPANYEQTTVDQFLLDVGIPDASNEMIADVLVVIAIVISALLGLIAGQQR